MPTDTDHCPVGELRRTASELAELIDTEPDRLATHGAALLRQIECLYPIALDAINAQPERWGNS